MRRELPRCLSCTSIRRLIADLQAVRAGHVGRRRAPHVVLLVVVDAADDPAAVHEVAARGTPAGACSARCTGMKLGQRAGRRLAAPPADERREARLEQQLVGHRRRPGGLHDLLAVVPRRCPTRASRSRSRRPSRRSSRRRGRGTDRRPCTYAPTRCSSSGSRSRTPTLFRGVTWPVSRIAPIFLSLAPRALTLVIRARSSTRRVAGVQVGVTPGDVRCGCRRCAALPKNHSRSRMIGPPSEKLVSQFLMSAGHLGDAERSAARRRGCCPATTRRRCCRRRCR